MVALLTELPPNLKGVGQMIFGGACVLVDSGSVGDDLADFMPQPKEEAMLPVPLLLGGEGGVSGLISGGQPK